jgi:hypothetical protein
MVAIKGGEGAARRGGEEGGDKRQRLSKHQRRRGRLRVSAVERAACECDVVRRAVSE